VVEDSPDETHNRIVDYLLEIRNYQFDWRLLVHKAYLQPFRSHLSLAFASALGRGRDEDRSLPPAQIRTSGFTAYGSYLGFWRQTAHLGKDEEHEPPAATD
jgi:hypothetical protein